MRRLFFAIYFLLLISPLKAQNGTWTWMHGSSGYNSPGTFGTQGVFAPANCPPALYECCEWTDLDGNFWLYSGIEASGAYSNALWKYDVSINQWAWMKGSSISNLPASYGTMGVASASNAPSYRVYGTLTWVDRSGNFWLFGGWGEDVNGNQGTLSELWKFNPLTLEWTWVRGPNVVGYTGSYGVAGIPSPSNDPAPRSETGTSWVDTSGNLWMFGGITNGSLMANDVWKYTISTNMWTWINGTQSTFLAATYGTKGIESASNNPGTRCAYAKGQDAYGCMYLYGGGDLNGSSYSDVWRFNPYTYKWTWCGGTATPADTGGYAAECIRDQENSPGSGMELRNSWSDSFGIWLFGGGPTFIGHNALWRYDYNSQSFALMSGFQPVSYGVQGVPSPTNMPPPRKGGISWRDREGNLWMFGGMSYAARVNDLWKYEIDSACVGPYVLPPPPPMPELSEPVVPNIFTPNEDGVNDLLIITGLDSSSQISIYNRWGNKIYASTGHSFAWNGSAENGEKCSDGVYYYIITTREEEFVAKGFFHIFR